MIQRYVYFLVFSSWRFGTRQGCAGTLPSVCMVHVVTSVLAEVRSSLYSMAVAFFFFLCTQGFGRPARSLGKLINLNKQDHRWWSLRFFFFGFRFFGFFLVHRVGFFVCLLFFFGFSEFFFLPDVSSPATDWFYLLFPSCPSLPLVGLFVVSPALSLSLSRWRRLSLSLSLPFFPRLVSFFCNCLFPAFPFPPP